ncbi:hypothetical protein ES677_01705 [Bizionia gelidisalsuginis]|uniref:CHRD domain-containing protein n=3 Tax=Flavobacteriaceae TaxID=49546 RepID=A0A8H2LD71_9FLAO|nr:hypothetical protein ES676_10720 [Bizionia saleffrena]TYC18121.1 hypothetical protein ES677_01705 [Bizionia gelidisalsuginis]
MCPLLLFVACGNDDDAPIPEDIVTQLASTTYDLGAASDLAIQGFITVIKNSNNTTTLYIELSGDLNAADHPAQLRLNTAAETGAVALELEAINNETGISSTTTSAYTYEDLIDFDGYVNVQFSNFESDGLLVQGDIGQNDLTTTSITYDLLEKDVLGASGNITFTKRLNGEALAVISLNGTPSGGIHPAHIHSNDAATTGPIIFTFNTVNGTTGISKTNVSALNDGAPFLYDDVLTVNGYINVHLSDSQLNVIVVQGNIGANN